MAASQVGIVAMWAGLACGWLGLIGWTEDPRDPAAPMMGWAGAVLLFGGGLLMALT